jgi:hypothetical protein
LPFLFLLLRNRNHSIHATPPRQNGPSTTLMKRTVGQASLFVAQPKDRSFFVGSKKRPRRENPASTFAPPGEELASNGRLSVSEVFGPRE